MREVMLDGAAAESREALHEAFAAALAFPEYYGHNLDALYDCLTEGSTPTRLVFKNMGALRKTLGHYANLLALVLEDAAAQNPALEVQVEE